MTVYTNFKTRPYWTRFDKYFPVYCIDMSKLVYHSLAVPSADSPFDIAIVQIAQQGSVKVVSPFIGISYLERVLALADDWVLISDVEAWLSSLSIRARPRAWQFIRENKDRIHHYPAIHAKTVIGEDLALLGSANLTNTGILGRTEMGILLDDPEQIAELHTWFDGLWQQTAAPLVDETSAFVQMLDAEALAASGRKKSPSLTTPSKRIRSRLVRIASNTTPAAPAPALNLANIAEGLLRNEAAIRESLKPVLDAAINAMAKTGFTFGDLVVHVQQVAGDVTWRDIFQALLSYCANHPRSVFELNTVNRLVLVGSKFTQSTAESLPIALAPFDAFLAVLIHHLNFDESRPLPSSAQLAGITHLAPAVQHRLIGSLAHIGLIQNERGGYVLAEDFEWPHRFLLLQKAYAQWNERITLRPAERAGLASTVALVLSSESEPDAYAHLEAPPVASSHVPQNIKPILVEAAVAPSLANIVEEDLPTKGASKTPKTPIPGAAMLQAAAVLTPMQLRSIAKQADAIFFELLSIIARQGPALRFSSVTAVATAVAKRSKHNAKLVKGVLNGREPGAPLLFHLYPEDGDCMVRLLPISKDEWRRLPRTKQALKLLGEEFRLGLEDPANWFVKPEKSIEQPVGRVTQDGEATQLERQNLIYANRLRIADAIFEAVAHLITRQTTTLRYGRINELALNIAAASKTNVATVLDVLLGRYKGIPSVFGFRFSNTGTTGATGKCRVTLIALGKSYTTLPRTTIAIQQFSEQKAAAKFAAKTQAQNKATAKIEAKARAQNKQTATTAAKTARAEKLSSLLAANLKARAERATAEATTRAAAPHPTSATPPLEKKSDKITLTRTLKRQIAAKDSHGREHPVQIIEKKKRVETKRI